MIDLEILAQACREIDEMTEKHNAPEVTNTLGVDLEGARYVAEQRALRGLLASRGGRETLEAAIQGQAEIHLSNEDQRMVTLLAGLWLDGMAAGLQARNIRPAHKYTREGGSA